MCVCVCARARARARACACVCVCVSACEVCMKRTVNLIRTAFVGFFVVVIIGFCPN